MPSLEENKLKLASNHELNSALTELVIFVNLSDVFFCFFTGHFEFSSMEQNLAVHS